MEPPDCQWGKQEANGSWTGGTLILILISRGSYPGVVGAVERGLADFSFNLLLTGQREQAIDFTVPYQGNAALFSKMILSLLFKIVS